VDEKKEDTYISVLADELTTTDPCMFYNTANHFYDSYWSNLEIKPEDTPTEMSLVDWGKHSHVYTPADTDV